MQKVLVCGTRNAKIDERKKRQQNMSTTILEHQNQKIGSLLSNSWYAQYIGNSILDALRYSDNSDFNFWGDLWVPRLDNN